MPIIQTLGNPGMKERHWEKISEIVGFPIVVDEDLTLEKIIDYGLDDYIEKFEAISEAATKENNLEKALIKMMAEWKDMEFTILTYKDTGTYILSAVDDIQVLLDDHLIKTQTMKNSPYIRPFEKEILSVLISIYVGFVLNGYFLDLGKRSCNCYKRFWTSGSRCNPHGCIWNLYSPLQIFNSKCPKKEDVSALLTR